MNLPHLPALRKGQPYESLDTTELKSVRGGEPVARVSQINNGLIRRDLRDLKAMRRAVSRVKARDLLDICKKAGDLFVGAELPYTADGQTQGADAFVTSLSATTGLPHALVRMNMEKVNHVFQNLETVMSGLTRGLDVEIFDDSLVKQDGIDVSYFPATDSLGVVLPSNSPGVNSLWLPAIAMKIPVILKPGREDPWTPYRMIQALIKAGCPAEFFGYYPTSHEGANTVLYETGKAIVFGGDATVEKYANNPDVQTHGAGKSKVLIGEDMVDQWPEFLDVLISSVAANSGRSCINASAIVTPRHGDEIADAIAKELAKIKPEAFDDPEAKLAGFANPAMADWIEGTLTEGLKEPGATDVTAKYREGGLRVERDNMIYIQPAVIRCDSIEHPLGNTEMLFPYCSVVEVPQAEMLRKIGPTLVGAVITKDSEWTLECLQSSNIDRLNIGLSPTNHVQWNQPHEGNLFEFLFRRRAIQREAIA